MAARWKSTYWIPASASRRHPSCLASIKRFTWPSAAIAGSRSPAVAANSLSADPASAQADPFAQPEPHPSPTPTKPRILIVEDDRAGSAALRSILMRKGCDVHVALTCHTGMRLLHLEPDHVILDLMLPDGDGTDILRRLYDLGQSSRVTVTTALMDPARLRQVQGLQPHRILRKPIDLVDLLDAIGMM